MINALKKILQDKKHRNIVIASVICIVIAGFAVWFFTGNTASDASGDPVLETEEDTADQIVMEEQQVPLGDMNVLVAAGDVVVVNVFAKEFSDVYGYQFEINYDSEYVEYNKRLHSEIDEIITIFATDKEWYLLVGATMIGDTEGFSGANVAVCRVEFMALADFMLNDDLTSDHFAISSVNTVTSDLQYLEDIEGWTATISVG